MDNPFSLGDVGTMLIFIMNWYKLCSREHRACGTRYIIYEKGFTIWRTTHRPKMSVPMFLGLALKVLDTVMEIVLLVTPQDKMRRV